MSELPDVLTQARWHLHTLSPHRKGRYEAKLVRQLADEIDRLQSLTRFQDRVIRSGNTAALTDSERELLVGYAEACELMSKDHPEDGHEAPLATLRGLLERFEPVSLSPMTIPPDVEDGSEDERIWRSDKDKPDE